MISINISGRSRSLTRKENFPKNNNFDHKSYVNRLQKFDSIKKVFNAFDESNF